MIVVVYVIDSLITVRKWRKSWKELRKEAGRNCYAVILLVFRTFVAYLTVKLSNICCVMCVEYAFQKLFHLVAQN